MQRVRVAAASGAYDVVVDPKGLGRAAQHIRPLTGERRLFIVADEHAWAHHGPRLERGLAGMASLPLLLQAGEERKRLAQIEALAEQMHAAGADRSSCVIAFGGGVAGDMGGFLAACYMRGIDVIQIPTTLLAQVDASVGGKTGVNLAQGKNLVGAFHQPLLVLIDPAALDTLPAREYRAGLFEVIKYGVIGSPALFRRLQDRRGAILQRDPQTLEAVIAASVRIKAEIVAQDERESDLRRILNFGHTLGHALEAETAYGRLLHGEAVGFGMVAAGRLAGSLEIFDRKERESLESLIAAYGPIPALTQIDAARLSKRIRGDKKTVADHVHFVLPERIGAVRVVRDPDTSLVQAAAESALESFRPGGPFTPRASPSS